MHAALQIELLSWPGMIGAARVPASTNTARQLRDERGAGNTTVNEGYRRSRISGFRKDRRRAGSIFSRMQMRRNKG